MYASTDVLHPLWINPLDAKIQGVISFINNFNKPILLNIAIPILNTLSEGCGLIIILKLDY